MAFVKATKAKSKARIALCGPSGAGKTYTSLKLATAMGGKVAAIDTERGSASKYADEFEFDVMELETFHPQKFIDGIKDAELAGYDVLVIDSLSHAWMGRDGILELHDKAASKQKTTNSFTAWRDVTPIHNQLIDTILQSKLHIIVTMRSKTEYVQTEENGKKSVKKVGMAPVQRDGMEYEFDIVGDMDFDNNLIITKTRCRKLAGEVIRKPGEETAQIIKDWLSDGVERPDKDRLKQLKHLAIEKGEAVDKATWDAWVQENSHKQESELTSQDVEILFETLNNKETPKADSDHGAA